MLIIYSKDFWPQDEFFDGGKNYSSFLGDYKDGQKRLEKDYNRFKTFDLKNTNELNNSKSSKTIS